MNYPMAIVIAAALIAGAMFFSNQNDLGAAGGGGEWAAVGVGVESGVARAWAVNIITGTMKSCRFQPGGITCFIE